MRGLVSDIRFALRMLGKDLSFTAVLVITLALGIGASTTIFSILNSVVLRPLPYPESDRLMRVYTEFHGKSMHLERFWMSAPEYLQLKAGCTSCESMGAFGAAYGSISGGDRPVRVAATYATASLLPTVGVRPQLGRWFSEAEDQPGDPTAIVLGHGLWQRAFGGDPEIIGRRVQLDAIPVTVVGVMPEGFDFPGDGSEAWVPDRMEKAPTDWGAHNYGVIVRLKPGVTLAQARGEIDSLMVGWAKGRTEPKEDEHFHTKDRHPIKMWPLKDEVVGSLASTLWLLQGAVLFVLLIAIANIASLLLARAEARNREIAVRHALGATRSRLIRQFLTESVVLGIVGGGLGILLAVWALDATVALIPASAPRVREIALDGQALGFALLGTLSASLLFGLAPIVHTRVDDLPATLKEGSQRTTGTRVRLRLRRALVITEVALAVVLVIGCGLMIRSFVRLQQVDLGFKPDHVLTFQTEVPERTYDDVATIGFHRRLQDRLRALPGVRSVTLMAGSVPSRPLLANDLALPGRTQAEDGPVWNTDYWQIVGDDFLATLGGRLVAGRELTRADAEGTPPVVMINEAFARKFFPGEDPLGKLVQITPWEDDAAPQTVVGVVADLKQAGVDRPAGTEVFLTQWQAPAIIDHAVRRMTAVIRTDGDPAALAPMAQRVVSELDPTLPVSKVSTMDGLLWDAVARPRFLTFLLGAFAGLALVLAAVGIYGVMAYTVAQRTREIGIRMALGAAPARVRTMVLRQAAATAAIGVAVGLLAAVALDLAMATALTRLMFGVEPLDPMVYALVGILVIAAAMLASWIPARRATRVEPTIALRAE